MPTIDHFYEKLLLLKDHMHTTATQQIAEERVPRRRVLYIRHRRGIDISDTFRLNQDEWCEAMSLLADVVLKDDDFDMNEACSRVQPDFIFYESPLFFPKALVIKNINTHPHIPRIAFMMQDPISPVRVNFLRTIADMNVRWIFTPLAEATLRQSPELRVATLSVSLLFNEQIFCDYGLPKDIPISVFGGFLEPDFYNWRATNARKITDYFPALIYAHPGYQNPVPRHKFMVTGEAYARLLNRSHFSLADSTRLDYLVRKHLEIPAAGAVLIAPDASVLKPYGFRDMENCILGEGDELFGKIAMAADNPDLYETIRRNGHDLVHSRYGRKNWRGILDFYECLRRLKPDETIQQQGLLGPFQSVSYTHPSMPAIAATILDSEVSSTFKAWMHSILSPEGTGFDQHIFSQIPPWLSAMDEIFILVGISVLLKSDLPQARDLFLMPQSMREKTSGLADYDPEEIAWLSFIAALTGDNRLLDMTRRESASMRHLSLRRMQWLGKVLACGGSASNPPPHVMHRAIDDRLSIHWTGQLDIRQWLGLMARILSANGQKGLLFEEDSLG